MTDNVKNYSKLCTRIGWAMLIFYSLFTLSTFGVAMVGEITKPLASQILINFVSPEVLKVVEFSIDVLFDVLTAIVYFLSFSIPAFILCMMAKPLPSSRRIYKSLRLKGSLILFIIAIIAVNFTISYLNANLVSAVLPSLANKFQLLMDSNLDDKSFYEVLVLFAVAIFSTAVVPAICEEYLFRGAILTNLAPYGKTTAIIGSAVLFGLMHQNPLQLLYTTLMGVAIGYVYVKTKSIWACMIIHFTNNFVAVLEEYLPTLLKKSISELGKILPESANASLSSIQNSLPEIMEFGWVIPVIDFAIIALGAIAVLILVIMKNRAKPIEENGSFGVVYERGMDVEEYPLEITHAQRVRRFFSVTTIIFTIIAIFSMGQIFIVYLV